MGGHSRGREGVFVSLHGFSLRSHGSGVCINV